MLCLAQVRTVPTERARLPTGRNGGQEEFVSEENMDGQLFDIPYGQLVHVANALPDAHRTICLVVYCTTGRVTLRVQVNFQLVSISPAPSARALSFRFSFDTDTDLAQRVHESSGRYERIRLANPCNVMGILHLSLDLRWALSQ